MHGIIAKIFESEISTNKSIIIEKIGELDKLKYPCFIGIDKIISKHKDFAIKNTLEEFKEHLFSTYLELR